MEKLSEVVHMEQISAGDPRHTVQGFDADPLFNGPVPHFNDHDPYEQDEDHLRKRTSRYDELLAAEVQVSTLCREAEQAAKEDIAGPSGKGKEVPKTPRRTLRKVSGYDYFRSALTDFFYAVNIPPSDSEEKEDGDEAPLSCVECLQKRITCVPQPGKKRLYGWL
ncbi:hypothetical protein M422DRAFT_249358 [Sphaerobolus stellatus SS14]|uniref:Uncharacterized protein n=1 Tax=Sphaerobolus stellatus (strain SS14) TaxID=990650 RepID=A0A0C9W5I7_SPHS4|nr:hypothetical protein M422DRAFT_249358 [Sphaerobolus stellatus SS14]